MSGITCSAVLQYPWGYIIGWMGGWMDGWVGKGVLLALRQAQVGALMGSSSRAWIAASVRLEQSSFQHQSFNIIVDELHKQ